MLSNRLFEVNCANFTIYLKPFSGDPNMFKKEISVYYSLSTTEDAARGC